MNENLSKKLKKLPNSAGVYFHKNSKDEIIYVGKAANLKNRVRQYFQNSRGKDSKTQALVAEIAMTDWIEVETEIDALFLESEMIKRYKPQYNILLRDDKSPSYVRIGFRDKIPHISFTKNPLDDLAEYFGPFYNSNAVKKSVRLLRKIFPYYLNEKLPAKNNLDFQIGLTPGLENFAQNSPEYQQKMTEYKRNLRQLARYLKGERKMLQLEIEKEMLDFAQEQNFEMAAKKRNQLRNLSELGRQIIFSNEEFLDISKDHALAKLAEILSLENPPRRIEAYDISHTGGENNVASMVVFSNGLSDKREYRKFKMNTGGNDDFAHMKEVLTRRFSPRNQKWARPDLVLIDGGKGQLSAALEVLPREIAAIGIAKRDEEIIVAQNSAVNAQWFEKNLSNFESDFRVRKEGEYFVANLHGQTHSHGHARNLLGENNSEFSDLTKLFQRIRDESHRFAINYHSNLRTKNQTKNALEEIDGVGAKTRAKLLRKFGSLKKIREASVEEISEVVSEKLAQKIKQKL
ncbi:MAG: excinuclease ABC subunit UvrC [bacterium]|nr:excinuclease ABC subunit UvrC [bacterium]